MFIPFLAVIILAAIGWLRFAMISIALITIDGAICLILGQIYSPSPSIMSVQEATSNMYDVQSGIVTDYLSVDIIIVMFFLKIGKDLYFKFNK